MAVIDEIYVKDTDNNRLPIDSYDNTVIDEIVIDGESYHFAKESSVTGVRDVVCDNAVEEPLINCVIQGNSFQDGTPTPEAPVEIQSVGELVTDETDTNYGKYKIPVVQRGINLTDGILEAGGIANATGENYSSDSLYRSKNYTKVKPNTLYMIYATKTIQFVFFYDKDYSFIKYTSENAKTFTTPENCKYIRYRVLKANSDITNIMLIEGSTAIEYEPYAEPIVTNIFLDEPLRKIGNYADVLDFKNKKIIRNVNVLTIEWTAFDSVSVVSNNRTSCILYKSRCPAGIFPNTISKCNYFSLGYETNNFRMQDAIYFYLPTDIYPSKTEANAWLKSISESDNPIVITYPLVVSTEESLDIELPKILGKTAIIEIDTELAPTSFNVDYWKQIRG